MDESSDNLNICATCGNSYTHKKTLRTHEKSHAGTLSFTCCEKGFASRRELIAHREINYNMEQERDIEDNIFKFEEQSWKTDFVIIVEGTRLHVAKNILSLASPVFDRMFRSEFKESKSGEIEMPTHKLEDVKSFLQCIYPNTFTPVSTEIAMQILPLVEEYQVTQLKGMCEKAITDSISEATRLDVLYTTLREAYIYGLKDVREKCVRLVAKKPKADPGGHDLPHEVINEILRLKIADLETVNKELKCTNSELQKRITNFEERDTASASNLKTLHEYVAKDLRPEEDLRLDSELKWKGVEVLIKLDPNNNCRSGREILIWDVKLSITTDSSSNANDSGSKWIAVELEKIGGLRISANIKARSILIHKKSKSENEFCRFSGQFTATNRKIKKYIKKTIDVTEKKQGFLKNERIWFLVQIFMSEPIRI